MHQHVRTHAAMIERAVKVYPAPESAYASSVTHSSPYPAHLHGKVGHDA